MKRIFALFHNPTLKLAGCPRTPASSLLVREEWDQPTEEGGLLKKFKCWFLVLIGIVTLAGCATTGSIRKAHYPNSITAEMQAKFDAADALYKDKRLSEADAAFATMISGFPYTELTDEARFRRGEIAFLKKDYEGALGFYREAVSQIESPAVAPKAHFKAGLALFKMNKASEALEEIGKINRRDASVVVRLRTDSLGVKASKAAHVASNVSVLWDLFLLDDYAESQNVQVTGIPKEELVAEDAALSEVKKWVGDNTVSKEQIESFPLKAMRGKRSGGFASYKLALVLHTSGDTKAATRELKAFVNTYPKHEYYGMARTLLGELGGAVGDVAGLTVGVILPLSGKYEVYGESVLHGIECAAGVYDPCVGPSGAKIIIHDSESMTAGAAAAVDELSSEGVVAIIGPLISGTAMEVAGRAEELGIPMISVSQREGVAEVGDYIFRNSVSDSSEISTLVGYAMGNLGAGRFYIVYPPNKRGQGYKNLFETEASKRGAAIVGAKAFAPAAQVQTIDELRGRFLTENKQVGADGEEPAPVDLPSNEGSFDAVFIPDSIGLANFVAGHMKLGGRTKILGISRWGDSGPSPRSAGNLEGAFFADSFYKESSDPLIAGFVANFKAAYGSEPTMLEALGFDAMRLILNAVQEKGATKRNSLRDALSKIKDFPGVTGKITFDEQGDAKRESTVLTIRNGLIQMAQ